MPDVARRVSRNLDIVRARIAAAAARVGRSAEPITLVAVTKYAPPAAIRAVVDAGCRDLGESRPQQLWQRATEFAHGAVHWHLIGHLQRNKVARTLPLVSLVHSCDSLRLAQAIDTAAAEQHGPPVPVLLEVNVSHDPAKHGLAPDELAGLLPALAGLGHVKVRGLMAMAGRADDPAAARADFRGLRELRDRLRQACPPAIVLDELSMGMSGDFDVAIEEGATIVRVGSALFEGTSE
ncbi:MAG: YggS family pyridoxal phosphate-dependent enzyme [Planctomycetia bacterium]|nr:YggS family pyridoxal phosphate-dependent enzyme [Planctomycetia bacterium]